MTVVRNALSEPLAERAAYRHDQSRICSKPVVDDVRFLFNVVLERSDQCMSYVTKSMAFNRRVSVIPVRSLRHIRAGSGRIKSLKVPLASRSATTRSRRKSAACMLLGHRSPCPDSDERFL